MPVATRAVKDPFKRTVNKQQVFDRDGNLIRKGGKSAREKTKIEARKRKERVKPKAVTPKRDGASSATEWGKTQDKRIAESKKLQAERKLKAHTASMRVKGKAKPTARSAKNSTAARSATPKKR